MRGYHVTFYDNLDSILKEGLIPSDTSQNNFPGAVENAEERLFFMIDKEAADFWYFSHHPRDYVWSTDRYQEPFGRGESIVVEFELPRYLRFYPDPYQNESFEMLYSFYVNRKIPADKILDIHDPETGWWKE